MSEGIKYDKGKPEMYLLPPLALLEVGKVLTYGAEKYAPDNWRKVPELQKRYLSACIRHLLDSMAGEENDSETGIDHYAHAICCLLFMLEDKKLGKREEERLGESQPREHRESKTTIRTYKW